MTFLPTKIFKIFNKEFINHIRAIAKISDSRRLYMYSILVGITSGLVALLFSYVLAFIENFTLHDLAGVDLGSAAGEYSLAKPGGDSMFHPLIFFLLPVCGLFLSGLVVQLFDHDAKGAGTDAMIQAFHEKEGMVKKRTPLVKWVATILNLAGGGSAGKEGPVAQIGSGLGSLFGRFLKSGARARRTLFIAGMAGGLGAVFRAPLGAAIISVEVLYREDFESDSLIPAIIASITGYFVFTLARGFDTVFHIAEYPFNDWRELYFYFFLGMMCFLFGYLFVKIHDAVEDAFSKMKAPLCIKTLIGGGLVGCIGLISWESIGSGFGFLQSLMYQENLKAESLIKTFFLDSVTKETLWGTVAYLFLIILLKMFSTAFTIGSGASGGVFGPSIFIGGVLGGLVGFVSNYYFPDIVSSPIPYIVVGMAGFFSGVANAPIGSVIMVCELTGSYQLLAPLLVVAVMSIIFSQKFSIYKNQKMNKFQSPAHEWDMTTDLLSKIPIQKVFRNRTHPSIIPYDFPSKKIQKLALQEDETEFIIKGKKGEYSGVFSLHHLSKAKKERLKRTKENISKWASQNIVPLSLDDSLANAMDFLLNQDLAKAPVVDQNNKLAGFISFKEILDAYKKSNYSRSR